MSTVVSSSVAGEGRGGSGEGGQLVGWRGELERAIAGERHQERWSSVLENLDLDLGWRVEGMRMTALSDHLEHHSVERRVGSGAPIRWKLRCSSAVAGSCDLSSGTLCAPRVLVPLTLLVFPRNWSRRSHRQTKPPVMCGTRGSDLQPFHCSILTTHPYTSPTHCHTMRVVKFLRLRSHQRNVVCVSLDFPLSTRVSS